MEVELRQKFIKDISDYLKSNKIKFELESEESCDMFTIVVNNVEGVILVEPEEVFVYNQIKGTHASSDCYHEYYDPENYNQSENIDDFLELHTFTEDLRNQGIAYKKLKALMFKVEEVYSGCEGYMFENVPDLINSSYFTEFLREF